MILCKILKFIKIYLHKFKYVLSDVVKICCKYGANWSIFRGRSRSLNFAKASGSENLSKYQGKLRQKLVQLKMVSSGKKQERKLARQQHQEDYAEKIASGTAAEQKTDIHSSSSSSSSTSSDEEFQMTTPRKKLEPKCRRVSIRHYPDVCKALDRVNTKHSRQRSHICH